MSKKNFIILFLIAGIAFILSFLNIRVCPIFNIFKVPCPGCGLTRSLKFIFTGHVKESLQYNILGIFLSVSLFVYLIFIISGHKKEFDKFLNKNQKVFILLAGILALVVWIINIRNPKLY